MSESTENARLPTILEAADCAGHGPEGADFALTCRWPDGAETLEHVSSQAAAALGYDPAVAAESAARAPRVDDVTALLRACAPFVGGRANAVSRRAAEVSARIEKYLARVDRPTSA